MGALVVLTVGCGGGGSTGASEPGGGGSLPEPAGGSNALPEMAGVVSCYGGIVKINDAPARWYLRQGFEADEKTLTQDTVVWSGANPARTWTVIRETGPGQLTMSGKYQGGTFTGAAATAMGEMGTGNWTYTGEITLDVGSKVKTAFSLADGKLVARSDAGPTAFIVEAAPIDDAACTKAFSTWPAL